MWHETRPPNSLYCTLWKWLYLAGRHVGDRPVGLDGLQLVQAPVKLLQSLKRHPEKCFICKDKTLCEDDHWGAVSVPPSAAGWREEEFVIWLLMLWLDWRWPRPWPSVPVTVVFLRDLKCPQLTQVCWVKLDRKVRLKFFFLFFRLVSLIFVSNQWH